MLATPTIKPVWISLGLDPVFQRITIIGLARTRAETDQAAKDRQELHKAPHTRSFCLADFDDEQMKRVGQEMNDWFLECGVLESHAAQLVCATGAGIVTMLDEIAAKRGWKDV